MRKLATLLLLLAYLLLFGSTTFGTTIAFSFSGIVTQNGGGAPFTIGEPFSGLIAYDLATPKLGPLSGLLDDFGKMTYTQNYKGDASTPSDLLQVNIGGNTFASTSDLQISIHDSPIGSSELDYFYANSGPLVVQLRSNNGLPFTSTSLPTSLNLSDFQLHSLSMPDTFGGFAGLITSLQNVTVPEPSTLALLALGVVGLVALRRHGRVTV